MSDHRFQTMAEDYDILAPVMVPYYGFMQSLMMDYLRIEEANNPVVVDLGAGSGSFLERILQRNSSAQCYYIDLSQAFMKVAKKKLQRYQDRIHYILADLEDGWSDRLPVNADYVFSMSAIHHLENHEKQRLYKCCFDLLNPGGWLVNIDEMKTIYADAYFNSLYYWDQYGQAQGKRLHGKYLKTYWKWQDHFRQWKIRNIGNFGQPKKKGDDIHESFLLQMAWMKEIGFQQVDLFGKIYLWCIIGGKKPK